MTMTLTARDEARVADYLPILFVHNANSIHLQPRNEHDVGYKEETGACAASPTYRPLKVDLLSRQVP